MPFLYEVASHVKNCPFDDYYLYYCYYHYYVSIDLHAVGKPALSIMIVVIYQQLRQHKPGKGLFPENVRIEES